MSLARVSTVNESLKPDMAPLEADEDAWYSRLREQWKPSQVRLLMIAESAPDDGGDEAQRRFFYADNLGADNLFRSMVDAMYGATKDDLQRTGKRPWLERLRNDGFFLIDLASSPVNALGSAARRRTLRSAVPGCVARAAALKPSGIIVVKVDLFAMLATPLVTADLPLLHKAPIPFPLGNTRAAFIEGFNRARSRLD